MKDKLARINDLIEEVQSEINQPIYTEREKMALADAQLEISKIKKNVQRTDYRIE
jgi:hypothetical protein